MIIQPIMPWWGLALLFTPIIGFVVWRIVNERHINTRKWLWVRRLIMVLLIIIISLRPSLPGGSSTSGTSMLDVYFVIDTTSSMIAEDYNGNQQRLEGVREDVKGIARELVGSRFSVITFANITTTNLPLTTDLSALATVADTIITQDSFMSRGSSIDTPIQYLKEEFERIKKTNPERERILFYIGDGEQTVDSSPKSFASIRSLIGGGAILGYGTTTGGRMQFFDYYDETTKSYIKDYSTGEISIPDALSKIDEENLRSIASQLGVKYFHRTNPDGTKEVTQTINIGEITRGKYDKDAYEDLYWLVAIPLALLLIQETRRQYKEVEALRIAQKTGGKL